MEKRKKLSEMEPGEKVTTSSALITGFEIDMFMGTGVHSGVARMFLDDNYAKSVGWKSRIAPGLLVFGRAFGLIEAFGLLDDAIAWMGVDDLKFGNATYPFDEITVEVELVSKRPTKTGNRGIVVYRWVAKNQHDEVVCSGTNTCMVWPWAKES